MFSETIHFNFLFSVENVMKSALLNCECDAVQPQVDTQRYGSYTSLKHLHSWKTATTPDQSTHMQLAARDWNLTKRNALERTGQKPSWACHTVHFANRLPRWRLVTTNTRPDMTALG